MRYKVSQTSSVNPLKDQAFSQLPMERSPLWVTLQDETKLLYSRL
jgi:hypothetical protein